MGKRGPAPKPTKSKVLQGTFRQDRAAKNEAQPGPVVPEKPAWFKLHKFKKEENKDRDIMKYANEFWDTNANKMAKIGLLTEIDILSFTLLCIAYGEFVNALLKTVNQGSTIENKESGKVNQNPYTTRTDKSYNKYKGMCREFGVTPSSRGQIEIDVEEKGKPSIEDVLSGKLG